MFFNKMIPALACATGAVALRPKNGVTWTAGYSSDVLGYRGSPEGGGSTE